MSQIACSDIRGPFFAKDKAKDKDEVKPPGGGGTQPPANNDMQSPKNVISSGFLNLSSHGITLVWTNPIDADFSKVLIVRNTSSISDIPTTGRNYANSTSIGGSTVVYNSNETAFFDTRAKVSTHYYYKLFAYDASFNYASGVEISGGGSKADHDGDGLIEIYTAEMLNNTRHNLAGTSYKRPRTQGAGNANGCPALGCNGYELTANIDLLNFLDINENRKIDTVTVAVGRKTHTVIDTGKDTSWVPIGDDSTGNVATWFTGTFEGNNHTIANLWVNISASSGHTHTGLFGRTAGMSIVRNVYVISGSIHAASSGSAISHSGGLVGVSGGASMITNCHFSGSGGVSSTSDSAISHSGGLVGTSVNSLTITKCTFSGSAGVSSASSSAYSDSGGLLGTSEGASTITNCSFSGSDGVVSSSASQYSNSGGLVGRSAASLVITNSYFSGIGGVFSSSDSSQSYSGGLVGNSAGGSLSISNSYFSGSGDISASSSSAGSDSGGLVGIFQISLTITNSYFSGSGGISSSSSSGGSSAGGLLGIDNSSGNSLTIINSYFAGVGGVSSQSYSGGLVGGSGPSMITNSYWNTDAIQIVGVTNQSPKRAQGRSSTNPPNAVGLTLVQLQATSGTSGMYPDGLLSPTSGIGDAWDLGTNMQLPAVKLCVPTVDTSATPPTTDWTMCMSYGDLLPEQR